MQEMNRKQNCFSRLALDNCSVITLAFERDVLLNYLNVIMLLLHVAHLSYA